MADKVTPRILTGPGGERWNKGCYDDGAYARIVANAPITACPSVDTIGQYAADSWRAGWQDADADLRKNPIAPAVAEETQPGTQDYEPFQEMGFWRFWATDHRRAKFGPFETEEHALEVCAKMKAKYSVAAPSPAGEPKQVCQCDCHIESGKRAECSGCTEDGSLCESSGELASPAGEERQSVEKFWAEWRKTQKCEPWILDNLEGPLVNRFAEAYHAMLASTPPVQYGVPGPVCPKCGSDYIKIVPFRHFYRLDCTCGHTLHIHDNPILLRDFRQFFPAPSAEEMAGKIAERIVRTVQLATTIRLDLDGIKGEVLSVLKGGGQ